MDKDFEIVPLDENKLTSSDTTGSSTTATDGSQKSTKTLLLDEIKGINERTMDKDIDIVSCDENKLTSSDTPGSSTTATDSSQKSTKTLLLEEIKGINERLVHVLVELDSDEDAAKGREGIIVTCTFIPVGLSVPLEILVDTMLPFPPLRLLILADYPESSPVILNDDDREEAEEFSEKVRLRFNKHVGELSGPASLEEMVGTWQSYIAEVINEYGQKYGYATFSSKK